MLIPLAGYVAVAIHALCASTPLAKLAGTPAVIPALRRRAASGESPSRFLPDCFPFPLDDFQLDTLRALDDGQSVVVSAPTGSGKTVCGELGCYLALARGQRVIYTTPLKALSNQKFYDLQQQFGRERVGLLTGDTCINREGSVLVMTTEVYRNMLLKREPDAADGDADGDDGSSSSGSSSRRRRKRRRRRRRRRRQAGRKAARPTTTRSRASATSSLTSSTT